LRVFRLRKHIYSRGDNFAYKGRAKYSLIHALYALLNPDDGSDHPKSNLLGCVRPGRSPAAKSISLQKTLCSVGLLYKTMNSLFVISVCYIADSAALLFSRVPFDRKVFGGS